MSGRDLIGVACITLPESRIVGQSVLEGLEMENLTGYYLPALIIVSWFALMYLISRISGWSQLALYYQDVSPYEGRRRRFQSASMRWMMGYNNCLTFGPSRDGLHISIMFPMRIAHPNLMGPWSEISSSKYHGRFFKGYRLKFARCPEVNFIISDKLMARITGAVEGVTPIREAN